MGRRRVVMISSQYPPIYGGAGQQAKLLAEQLVVKGWQIRVVTLDQAEVGSDRGGQIHVTRVLRGLAPSTASARALTSSVLGLAAALVVLVTWPRVVHLHGSYWWGIPASVASKLVGAKLIVKVTRDGEDDPDTVFQKRFGPLKHGKLYGLNFSLADDVILLNDATYRRALSHRRVADKARRINNGVDGNRYGTEEAQRCGERVRKQYGIDRDTKIVLFVGYLAEHKGVIDLVKAWGGIGRQIQCQLWMVGPMQGFYRELSSEVVSNLKSLAGEENIRLFGPVDNAKLPGFYAAADIFALPSYAEGMPNSLAEAIVSACAIVASDIPGVVDIVDRDTAFLHSPGDVDALRICLSESLESGKPSSPETIRRLDIRAIASQYDSLYCA